MVVRTRVAAALVSPQQRKEAALEFLRRAAAGDAEAAGKKFLAAKGTHHNVHVAAGWPALVKAMQESARQNPQARLEVKQAICEGDLVAVLSHMVHRPGTPGIAVVHWFRFLGDKIVEMWDIGTELPMDSPNRDGPF